MSSKQKRKIAKIYLIIPVLYNNAQDKHVTVIVVIKAEILAPLTNFTLYNLFMFKKCKTEYTTYDINVVYAAAIAPKFGIKIAFKTTFKIAAKIVIKAIRCVFPYKNSIFAVIL